MRIKSREHTDRSWRVHELVRDFDLLDVWEIPAVLEAGTLSRLSESGVFQQSVRDIVGGPVKALFELRLWLGSVFGWDRDTNRLPVPGCTELSVRERLTVSEQKSQPWFGAPPPPPQGTVDFQLVYHFKDEALLEVGNHTVHALVHAGMTPASGGGVRVRLAVYAKPRGLYGRLYMAAIKPFRELVVYPALLPALARAYEVDPRPAAGMRRVPTCST